MMTSGATPSLTTHSWQQLTLEATWHKLHRGTGGGGSFGAHSPQISPLAENRHPYATCPSTATSQATLVAVAVSPRSSQPATGTSS